MTSETKYRVQDLTKEPLKLREGGIKAMYAVEVPHSAITELFVDPARFLASQGIPAGGGEVVTQIKKFRGGSPGGGVQEVIIIKWGDGTYTYLFM